MKKDVTESGDEDVRCEVCPL